MFLLIRAITYASLFIGFLLVFLPARVLSWSGIVRPVSIGAAQVAGMVVGASGAALTLWCIATFIVIGRGTPAPFDPPRRLVVVGPYGLVRNPTYIGATLALAGSRVVGAPRLLCGHRVHHAPVRRGLRGTRPAVFFWLPVCSLLRAGPTVVAQAERRVNHVSQCRTVDGHLQGRHPHFLV